jgi:hypothetical protein
VSGSSFDNLPSIRVPEGIQSHHEWRRSINIRVSCPSVEIWQEIASTAFTPSMKPTIASGNEPSASSGEFWIDGYQRFVASAGTFQETNCDKLGIDVDSGAYIFDFINQRVK